LLLLLLLLLLRLLRLLLLRRRLLLALPCALSCHPFRLLRRLLIGHRLVHRRVRAGSGWHPRAGSCRGELHTLTKAQK
jgi:hypothetical protein